MSPSRIRCRGAARVCALCAAALAALAVVALVGCGSSGRPTKAQYIARANALCRAEHQRLISIALSPASSLQAEADEVNRVRAQTNQKLAALKKPVSGGVLSDWLKARAAALSFARKVIFGKTKRADPARRAAERGYTRETDRAFALARSYGLTDCKGFAAS